MGCNQSQNVGNVLEFEGMDESIRKKQKKAEEREKEREREKEAEQQSTPINSLPPKERSNDSTQEESINKTQVSSSSHQMSHEKEEKVKVNEQETHVEEIICQIQVENIDEKNEKMLKRREMIINEIISTERSYVTNMILTNEIFIEPLQKSTILESTIVCEQFRDYTLIRGLHEQFLREIDADDKSSSEPYPNLLSNFIRYIPMMKMYRNYLQHFEKRFYERTKLMETCQPYRQFITSCREDDRCKGHYLESFLVEPVQRIPRYKLLLEQVSFFFFCGADI
jgi:hypothetical protein